MTNEQLAVLIKQGGNDELIPILWERVRKLLYSKSVSYYNSHLDLCRQRGVDEWDIKQECYKVLLNAVQGFEDVGYKFTSYLSYPFQNAVQDLLGLRKRHSDPLNICTSLDKPVEQSDGETTMYELVPDDTPLFTENIDRQSESETIHYVVDELAEPYRTVINAHYFKGMQFNQIAQSLNLSAERVRQIHYKALQLLRKNHTLLEIYSEYKRHYDWLEVSSRENIPNYFEICRKLRE